MSSSSAIGERHRHDQEHRRDIVEERGKYRRGELQHQQDAGGVRLDPLRRPDRQILEQAGTPRDRDQDHDPGEEADGIPVDALDRLVLIERADGNHRRCAKERHHRAIMPAADDEDVGDDEERHRDQDRVEAERDVGDECGGDGGEHGGRLGDCGRGAKQNRRGARSKPRR